MVLLAGFNRNLQSSEAWYYSRQSIQSSLYLFFLQEEQQRCMVCTWRLRSVHYRCLMILYSRHWQHGSNFYWMYVSMYLIGLPKLDMLENVTMQRTVSAWSHWNLLDLYKHIFRTWENISFILFFDIEMSSFSAWSCRVQPFFSGITCFFVITGAEAMFADLGHFSVRSIQVALPSIHL